MALSNGPSPVVTDAVIRRSGSEPQPESKEDLEKLESDLPKMAQKILEYRATLPDELKATRATVLSVQRPILPGMDAGPSEERNSDSRQVESSSENSMTDGEKRTTEKIVLVEDKSFCQCHCFANCSQEVERVYLQEGNTRLLQWNHASSF